MPATVTPSTATNATAARCHRPRRAGCIVRDARAGGMKRTLNAGVQRRATRVRCTARSGVTQVSNRSSGVIPERISQRHTAAVPRTNMPQLISTGLKRQTTAATTVAATIRTTGWNELSASQRVRLKAALGYGPRTIHRKTEACARKGDPASRLRPQCATGNRGTAKEIEDNATPPACQCADAEELQEGDGRPCCSRFHVPLRPNAVL